MDHEAITESIPTARRQPGIDQFRPVYTTLITMAKQ